MKDPKSICVTLETAKRLRESGFEQETIFRWYGNSLRAWSVYCVSTLDMNEIEVFCKMSYPAPTSAEIELPHYIDDQTERHFLNLGYLDSGKTIIKYIGIDSDLCCELANTEVEAKAACWLWLKKEGLIKKEPNNAKNKKSKN